MTQSLAEVLDGVFRDPSTQRGLDVARTLELLRENAAVLSDGSDEGMRRTMIEFVDLYTQAFAHTLAAVPEFRTTFIREVTRYGR